MLHCVYTICINKRGNETMNADIALKPKMEKEEMKKKNQREGLLQLALFWVERKFIYMYIHLNMGHQ